MILFKIGPISDCSQSNSRTRYQKILWKYPFACKGLLGFTCLTMKFHNCHHTTKGYEKKGEVKHVDKLHGENAEKTMFKALKSTAG